MGLLPSCRFHVIIGPLEMGFSKVWGLERQSKNIHYREGGLNDRVHVLPGPVSAGSTLHLERGAYAGELPLFYLAGESLTVPVRVEVRGERDKTPGKVYTLTGVVVKKWEVSELNGMESGLVIDRFELEYEHMAVSMV